MVAKQRSREVTFFCYTYYHHETKETRSVTRHQERKW
jgi:hypothetical protein